MALIRSVLKRGFSTSGQHLVPIKHVTVIGGGLMGSGIAQVAAQSDHNVTLLEVTDELLRKAQDRIEQSVSRVAKKQYKDDVSKAKEFIKKVNCNICATTDLEKAAKGADLIVEAIVEHLPVKHELFGKLDKLAPKHTIFASNTSSLSIDEIASVTTRSDRFGGLHFFNPVPVMKLLEVVKAPKTTAETHAALIEFGKAVGKTCISCKDTPGFVVNRLLVPYLAEAARMMERGVATIHDIDTAMKLGAGYPMGPLELADYVGLDTTQAILKGWSEKYPDEALFKPIAHMEKLIKEGKFGRKSGEGFYKY